MSTFLLTVQQTPVHTNIKMVLARRIIRLIVIYAHSWLLFRAITFTVYCNSIFLLYVNHDDEMPNQMLRFVAKNRDVRDC